MTGVFKFYQNGVLIAESPNLITNEGKKMILRRLAGQAGDLGGAIGIGTTTTPATTSDSRLGFEVDRATVALRYPDFTNQIVIFKASLPVEASYTIYEAGLWSQGSDSINALFASRTLTLFDQSIETWTNSTVDTTNGRASTNATKVTAGINSTVSTRQSIAQIDLSGYSGADAFNLAFYKPDANVTTLTLSFEDSTTGGSLKSAAVAVSALPVGYNNIVVAKSTFTPTGTIDWSTIDRFGVDVHAGATSGYVVLDGLRIEDTDTINPNYVLVSHTILPAPKIKTATAPLEIEYALEFTVG